MLVTGTRYLSRQLRAVRQRRLRSHAAHTRQQQTAAKVYADQCATLTLAVSLIAFIASLVVSLSVFVCGESPEPVILLADLIEDRTPPNTDGPWTGISLVPQSSVAQLLAWQLYCLLLVMTTDLAAICSIFCYTREFSLFLCSPGPDTHFIRAL